MALSFINWDDESRMLMCEMQRTVYDVQVSAFYQGLLHQLQTDSTIKCNISRVMGYGPRLTMVIYAVGSIEYSYISQYQLALAIALKRDLPHWIEAIEAFDPVFSPRDIRVMEAWGIKVLRHNEYCRWLVREPTLFYMPFPESYLIWNLLDASWFPGCLNKMIILANSLDIALESMPDDEQDDWEIYSVMAKYSRAIEKFFQKYQLPEFCCGNMQSVMDFYWHFFDLDPEQEVGVFLPGQVDLPPQTRVKLRLEIQELPEHNHRHFSLFVHAVYRNLYLLDNPDGPRPKDWGCVCSIYRGPILYRQRQLFTPAGVLILNFAAKKGNCSVNAAFGGSIIHAGNTLLSYSGNAADAGSMEAHAMGMLVGLVCMQWYLTPETKIIIQSDSIAFIRCVNQMNKAPDNLVMYMTEISELLKDHERACCHVYETVNPSARKLANAGSLLPLNVVWVSPPQT